MMDFYRALYMITLSIEAITIFVFGYFLSKYPKNRFRHFLYIIISVFVMILIDYVLRFYYIDIQNSHPDLFRILFKLFYVAYGAFMIFRFLFIHELLNVNNKALKNSILLFFSMAFIGISLSPFFVGLQN